jgi:hypothetical protein
MRGPQRLPALVGAAESWEDLVSTPSPTPSLVQPGRRPQRGLDRQKEQPHQPGHPGEQKRQGPCRRAHRPRSPLALAGCSQSAHGPLTVRGPGHRTCGPDMLIIRPPGHSWLPGQQGCYRSVTNLLRDAPERRKLPIGTTMKLTHWGARQLSGGHTAESPPRLNGGATSARTGSRRRARRPVRDRPAGDGTHAAGS